MCLHDAASLIMLFRGFHLPCAGTVWAAMYILVHAMLIAAWRLRYLVIHKYPSKAMILETFYADADTGSYSTKQDLDHSA